MILPVDRALQRLRAEIIAPDWRLSPRRIAALEAAFSSLRESFSERKAVKAILAMAENALQYLKSKGEQSVPEVLDFLKEAMAALVTIHEEAPLAPADEEAVVHRIYGRFQKVKEKIRTRRSPGSAAPGIAEEEPVIPPPGSMPSVETLPPEGKQEASAGPVPTPDSMLLIAELQELLHRANQVSAALRQCLEAQSAAAGAGSLPASASSGAIPPAPAPAHSSGARPHPPVRECPATTLREVVLHGQAIGVPEEGVALVRPLAEPARTRYLQERQVPLRDFRRVFHGLSRQFGGVLAGASDRKLREMVLPVITLRAFGIPEQTEKEAAALLILSHGNWHGVLLCGEVRDELRTMGKFQKILDGDLSGIGFLEDGGELPVINLPEILRREGFLLV